MSDTALRTVNGRNVPAAGAWTIDPSHSSVTFTTRHLMIAKVKGSFSDFTVDLKIGEAPEDSSVNVSIAVASISTGDPARDGHLLSPDFFNVEVHPAITYNSTSVEPINDTDWKVTGDLTIAGTTKPVVLNVEFAGVSQDPWGNTKAGFTATTEVDREDFGLTWNQALETGGVLVGKAIKIEIEIEASPA